MPKAQPRTVGKAPQKRRRRTTAEVIDRIMEAAREEFETHGYAGAKTAAIARKAGVAEALIFNNFGSKAKLFNHTIFQPLDQHFVNFCATHLVAVNDEAGLRAETRQYILELQQFIRRHSRMLKSLVAAQLYGNGDVQGLSDVEGLHDFFEHATERSRKRLAGQYKIDPRVLARVSFAAILACILFEDWLFPKGLAGERKVTEAICDFVMEGLDANEDRDGPPSFRQRPARRTGNSPTGPE